MDLIAVAVTGALAGLAVAMPFGPIGLLLLRTAMREGLRPGLAGAAAVAVADTLWCTVAVLAGAAARPVIAALGPWPAIAAGAVLVAIGARQLALARRVPVGDESPAPARPSRVFATVLAATLVNPGTILPFAAVATGTSVSGVAAVVFVVAAGLASMLWQSVLVVAGARLGAALSARWAQRLGVGASILLVVGGVAIAIIAILGG